MWDIKLGNEAKETGDFSYLQTVQRGQNPRVMLWTKQQIPQKYGSSCCEEEDIVD